MDRYILNNADLATMAPGLDPYGLVQDGAIVVEAGKIAWVGARAALPDAYSSWSERNLGGCLVTPALIDCHSHIVYGGNRSREFEMRLEGASYEELARAGGGILSTVNATRAVDRSSLIAAALPRVDALISEGAATLEIKSGYGLDLQTELTMLSAARGIASERPVRIFTSFLGAHAVPTEYSGRPDAYIDEICIPALMAAHAEGLVDAVDGFCESIAFTPEQIDRVFAKATELQLPVKLHAEQLSNLGGAKLAARYRALSADHLEYATQSDCRAMARSGTVAVVLPGAFYTLCETKMPPIAAIRENGVPLAIATDCNPGSSPLTSLLLAMNMACTLFRLTPAEALAGTTRNAARALGLDDAGIIAPGLRADLAVWDLDHPAELAYRIGFNPLTARIFEGRECARH